MTHTELRDALHDLASQQPPFVADPSLFHRAQVARRRRRTTLAMLAAAAVALVVVLPRVATDGVAEPADGNRVPSMPDRVYTVPDGLTDFTEAGVAWDERMTADGLAVGPLAVVFANDERALTGISAVDHHYVGLKLPGFGESAFFRFDASPVALSPDGRRLAYTWHPYVISSEPIPRDVVSGVRILDLETGRVRDVRVPGDYGVFAQGFGWSPDGRYLGYGTHDVTAETGNARGGWVERLDLRTGQRVANRELAYGEGPVSVDRRGRVVSGDRLWDPATGQARRLGEHPTTGLVVSPDGTEVAGGSLDPEVLIYRGRPGRITAVPNPDEVEPDRPASRVVGWRGAEALLYGPTERSDFREVTAVGQGAARLVRVDPLVLADDISFATDLFGDVVEAPEPGFPRTGPPLWVVPVLGAALLLPLALWWWRRRRQRAQR